MVPYDTVEESMTEHTTLTVRIGNGEETRRETLDRVRTLERGARLDDRYVLVLEDEADLQRLLSPANLGLLRAIRAHEPESMRAAADLVDRDFKEVHRNLTELETLNVVEFEERGRSKRPVVQFDEIDVEVSLTDDGGGSESVTP
jgi:predicted transcriptional regulator